MTSEEWDVHWNRIYDDVVMDGAQRAIAKVRADAETVEQFGPRPEEAA